MYLVVGFRESYRATHRGRTHKHFQWNASKIKRPQVALRASTETEAIDRALDLVISEHHSNRLALEANERFASVRAGIQDVYGKLEP